MTIELNGVVKAFGDHLVVNNVSLQVNDGELFVLLGSSGSGKSTLLRLIAGLVIPDDGAIALHGKDVTTAPPQKREVGFVFQNYALFKHLSARENVEFGLRIRKVSKAERRQRADELLDLVGLSGFGERMPAQLSGGQRQRVALARALVYRPQVLLLDEPFGALDIKIRSQLRKNLREIQRQLKITTILVTHDQEEAFELADRIAILGRGRLAEIGTPHALYHKPKTEYAATFLGGGNVLVGRVEQGVIRLGSATIPFPSDSPLHEEGSPVRILFRPEHVQVSTERPPAPLVPIGEGKVLERSFTGAFERARFELETLRGVRPLAPTLSYGQPSATLDVTQTSSSDAVALPQVGEKRWISLRHYHVLQPSGLQLLVYLSGPIGQDPAIDAARVILTASHGYATVLHVARPRQSLDDARKAVAQVTKTLSAGGDLHVEGKARQGIPSREVVREVQEHEYDMMIVGRTTGPQAQQLGFLARRALVYGRIPLLVASSTMGAIRRVLVCIAAGEQGKTDVRFAARIARHTGAFVTVFHVLRRGSLEEERRRVERHLTMATALLQTMNVKSEITLANETPREAIVRQATSGNYDLVVIGASEVSLSTKQRGRDFAAELIEALACSVAVVPMND